MSTWSQARERFPSFRHIVLTILLPWLAFSTILFLVGRYNYLFFHSFAELFSISVAAAVFMLAWNTRRFASNDLLFVIGVSYLFVAILDLFHTLAYKGMGVFPIEDANPATQLWIAARYLQSLSLLAAVLLMRKRIDHRLLLSVFSAVTLLLLAAIALGIFPDCYINGLTPFKKVSEYIIAGIFAIAVLRLRQEVDAFSPGIQALITLSIVFTILAELTFTFYINVDGLLNTLGHIFKIIAVYCIYKAVIATGLNQPFDLLFHGMKKREEELQSSQKLLHEIAMHDQLTGLPNRLLFEARLKHALEKSQRNHFAGNKTMVQLIIMDMDDFKNINDMLGHLGGDEVLRELARRLQAEIRQSDTAARWGGDEFTCVLEDVASIEDAENMAQKILAAMSQPMILQEHELEATVSVGFSLFPLHGQDEEGLLRNADAALYCAKQTKNRVLMYNEGMRPFTRPALKKLREK